MAEERAQKVFRSIQNRHFVQYGTKILNPASITRAWFTDGRLSVEFSMQVEKGMTDSFGDLHNGALLTIVDEMTAIAVWAQDPEPRFMTSTDLAVSNSGKATLNDTLRMVATCDSLEGHMAFASIQVFVGERLVATGTHSLFKLQTPTSFE